MRFSDWSSYVCSSDLGLVVFVWGKPWLLGRGEPPDPARLAAPVAGIRLEWWLSILSILSIGVVWWLVQNQAVVGTLMGISGAILDRKCVESGKSVSVRVDLGGRRIIKKKHIE